MQESGKWTINVNRLQKTVDMVIIGSFTPERAAEFVRDYQAKVGSIQNSNDFTLTLDCRQLDLVKPERVKDLEGCYLLYKQTGFKKVVFEINKNVVLKMQLNRLARNTGLKTAEVLEV